METAYATNSKRGVAVFTNEGGYIKFESNLFAKEDGLLVKRVKPTLVVSACVVTSVGVLPPLCSPALLDHTTW